MGMTQVRRDPDFAEKPVLADCAGELRVKHLDGDTPSMRQVDREIDSRHPSASQLPFELVPGREGVAQLIEQVRHRVGRRA
jgi:hypothetical protein